MNSFYKWLMPSLLSLGVAGILPAAEPEPPSWKAICAESEQAGNPLKFTWEQYSEALLALRKIAAGKLYYDAAAGVITSMFPLTPEEKDVVGRFNGYFRPVRDYIMRHSKGDEALKQYFTDSVGQSTHARTAPLSNAYRDKYASFCNMLDALKDAFEAKSIVWDASKKECRYTGSDAGIAAQVNELNRLTREYIELYAKEVQVDSAVAEERVHAYLKSVCAEGKAPETTVLAVKDRNPLFMVVKEVNPYKDPKSNRKTGESLHPYSMYYTTPEELEKYQRAALQHNVVTIQLFSDFGCRISMGYVSSDLLIYRPHNQLLRMVPNHKRGMSRAIFFNSARDCFAYLEPKDRNDDDARKVDEMNMESVQDAIIDDPLSHKSLFAKYSINATEPSTGQANNDNEVLFPIVSQYKEHLNDGSLVGAADQPYDEAIYGVQSVTHTDALPGEAADDPVPGGDGDTEEQIRNVLKVYIVMDLTGSMTPFKNKVLESFHRNFVKPLSEKNAEARMTEARFGFIGYKDSPITKAEAGITRKKPIPVFGFLEREDGEPPTSAVYNYTHQGMVTAEEFPNVLGRVMTASEQVQVMSQEDARLGKELQTLVNGDDMPEEIQPALEKVMQPAAWRSADQVAGEEREVRIVILIGDAPDHNFRNKFDVFLKSNFEVNDKRTNTVFFPFFIWDKGVQKSENKKARTNGRSQFARMASIKDGLFVVDSDELGQSFDQNFSLLATQLMKALAGQASRTEEQAKQTGKKLEDEGKDLERQVESASTQAEREHLEMMLQASKATQYVFGRTMSVWVSDKKKAPLDALNVERTCLWVSSRDPLTFKYGRDAKDPLGHRVMEPSVLLTMRDADIFLDKCQGTLAMFRESNSGDVGNNIAHDLQMVAKLAANFTAVSTDPAYMLRCSAGDLEKVFRDPKAMDELPYQSQFAKQLYEILVKSKKEGDVTFNLAEMVGAMELRLNRLRETIELAKKDPAEHRVFFSPEAHDMLKGKSVQQINEDETLQTQSAVLVPYADMP